MTMNSYQIVRRIGITLDPVHVGAGGTKLGRVDNVIVRDPVTQIPKIPGSSLAGVMRAYSAMAKAKYPRCAGQGIAQSDEERHCGEAKCPICTVFGSAKQSDREGFAGLAGFSDMHILFFPVSTSKGPVWLTSPLGWWNGTGDDCWVESAVEDNAVYLSSEKANTNRKAINLGWLYLPVKTDSPIDANEIKKMKLPQYRCNNGGWFLISCSPILSTAIWR